MIRRWAFWRRFQYGTGFLFVLILLSVLGYYRYGYVAPNCFDNTQNGEERGVDCGGACERVCSMDITAPTALWAESFKIIDGQYNAVAYIENRNEQVGTPELAYTLRLFDDAGLIVERTGTTVLPPDGVYPVFEGRLMTGDREPTRTTIEFDSNVEWQYGSVGRSQFSVERRELVDADSEPRLMADIRNSFIDEAQDVEIIATIFDAAGNPLTAARTILQYFPGYTTQSVTFTWPQPIAKTLRSCEIPTDVVLAIDLSGSMNDDGGTPPQPLTSVLAAARSFVTGLNEKDQIGVVTYATNATVDETLTRENDRVAEAITKHIIDPSEERGSTNTGDAFKRIKEELSSSRHNPDARKVGILLTDGLATAPGQDPEAHAITESEAVKGMDIEVFTIGLGEKLNEDFLRSLASSPSQYYKAPSIQELQGIYSAITASICEDGPAVIEIVAKPKTSFRQ